MRNWQRGRIPLIKAIEEHPNFRDKALLDRIHDLLKKRAKNLISLLTASDYKPGGCIVRVDKDSAENFPSSVDNVLMPSLVVEQTLGLVAGDVGKLAELGMIEDQIPVVISSPCIALADVVTILKGKIPKPRRLRHRLVRNGVVNHNPVFIVQTSENIQEYIEADLAYPERLKRAFGEHKVQHTEMLIDFCNGGGNTTSCRSAELMLGLESGDLELLARVGAIPIVPSENSRPRCPYFFLADLVRSIDKPHFTITPIPYYS